MRPRFGACWGVAICVVALVLAACDPHIEPIDPSLGGRTITPNGDDKYGITVDGDVTTAAAPTTNTGISMRTVFWRLATPVDIVDQETCGTWANPDSDFQQPGAALRIRTLDEGKVRAITITKNVIYGLYATFNVHVMDSSNPEQPYTGIGQFKLWDTFYDENGNIRPYPWRMCARAVGETVSFIVWPLDGRPQPAWDDPAYGGSVTLPPGWSEPGVPGWYIGHLKPGESVDFLDLTTANLATP